jgi:RimJ/RimL family protein N-acetyltransferase
MGEDVSEERREANGVEVRGERIVLRDQRPSDVDARLRWLTVETEWGEWDAPWEGNDPLPPERVEEVRRGMLEAMRNPLPAPRTRLFIELVDRPPVGWVSCYDHDPDSRTVSVGIDICESQCWGRGLGTEALRLWIDYLFAELGIERVRMATWSGNERMVRVAEKLSFVLEERIPNAREVRGRRYDKVQFVLTKRARESRP